MNKNLKKPLGKKAYGSTPHLIGSRVGAAEHTVPEGQSELFTGIRSRRGDRFIVTEKIDGSCVAVAKHEGNVIALSRGGYLSEELTWPVHYKFGRWVEARKAYFDDMLMNGERLAGEWLYTAMGTRYKISDPDKLLVGFSIINAKGRIPYDDFTSRLDQAEMLRAHVLSDGAAVSIEDTMKNLGEDGFHGALDGVEGAVWVHEAKGKFQSIAKFVKHDKIDGKYMPSISGEEEIVNYIGPEF